MVLTKLSSVGNDLLPFFLPLLFSFRIWVSSLGGGIIITVNNSEFIL